MARIIDITCPTCKYEWQVDLDQSQAQKVVFKGLREGQPKTKEETYRFKCPHDGAWVVAEVTIEE